VFERQVEALALRGDIVFGLSTSGRSPNVLRALAAARKVGAVSVAMTGQAGLASGTADFTVAVPSLVTAHIQEVHIMLIHYWCALVDEALHD